MDKIQSQVLKANNINSFKRTVYFCICQQGELTLNAYYWAKQRTRSFSQSAVVEWFSCLGSVFLEKYLQRLRSECMKMASTIRGIRVDNPLPTAEKCSYMIRWTIQSSK